LNNIKGFTLTELIIVIVIVGILSVFIIPKIEISPFKESADVNTLYSNLRYAQHKSMVTGDNWRVKIISSQNEYIIDNDSNDNNVLPSIPAQDNPVKVNTNIAGSLNEFYFDFLGEPVDSAGDKIASEIIITIDTKNIVLEPYSGGIYVQ